MGEPHLTVGSRAIQTAERETWTEILEGDWDALIATAGNYNVGVTAALPSGATGAGYQEPQIITALQLSQKEGGLGLLQYSITATMKRESWSVDMAEISKDIRTWLVTAKGGMTQAQAADTLGKIRMWEAFGNSGDYTRWQNFNYGTASGQVLTGTARILAEKMIKGVNSYTIYAPIITRQSIWTTIPPMGDVGTINTPYVRDGWSVIGGADVESLVGLANAWLKTAERSNPNGDGTYTFVEQWTGADDIDGDLYPQGTSGA